MKFYSASPNSIWQVIVFTIFLGALGCAQGGPGIATGNCSVAVGGPATITISPEFRLSLGDSAIEAASRALGLYLTKLPGPIGPTEKKQATATVVDAAERTKGSPLTAGEKSELEHRSQEAVNNYQTLCHK